MRFGIQLECPAAVRRELFWYEQWYKQNVGHRAYLVHVSLHVEYRPEPPFQHASERRRRSDKGGAHAPTRDLGNRAGGWPGLGVLRGPASSGARGRGPGSVVCVSARKQREHKSLARQLEWRPRCCDGPVRMHAVRYVCPLNWPQLSVASMSTRFAGYDVNRIAPHVSRPGYLGYAPNRIKHKRAESPGRSTGRSIINYLPRCSRQGVVFFNANANFEGIVSRLMSQESNNSQCIV